MARATGRDLGRLPYSIRILLENAARHCGLGVVEEKDVLALLEWDAAAAERPEFAFMPGRVLLQDFTGVPCVVDLAALRSAVARSGGDPKVIDPNVAVDLVIDHSVQVDCCAVADACSINMGLEMERNAERYALLRWAQGEFGNLRVMPPGTGICHQVNLEFLAEVVRRDGSAVARAGEAGAAPDGAPTAGRPRDGDRVPAGLGGAGLPWAYPDTVIGTDSHTTMINGLGVLGWGVGGIEAEAVMVGQPYFMLVPQVVGVRMLGSLPDGATATDLVLTVTELLRGLGVVGRFVEYFGPGAEGLSLADRATVANMAPEYGATCGFFPVDAETIAYLRQTGRPDRVCARVEAYCRASACGGSRDRPTPSTPGWPNSTSPRSGRAWPVPAVPKTGCSWRRSRKVSAKLCRLSARAGSDIVKSRVELDKKRETIADGSVVIASITSCTNTSNPALMLMAGLLARNALALGLKPPRWVQDQYGPGLPGRDGLPGRGRIAGADGSPGFRHGGLWLCHLHRQQWPPAGTDLPGR